MRAIGNAQRVGDLGSLSPSVPTQSAAGYADLRERIIRLELAPGTGVSVLKLAEVLPYGVGPVRYAIQRLAAERLLLVSPRGQTLVAPITISEVGQSYAVRTSLEILASRSAAKRGPLDLPDRLAPLVAGSRAAADADDYVRVVDISRTFWAMVVVGAHNDVLSETLLPILAITQRFEYFLAQRRNTLIFDRDNADRLVAAIASRSAATADAVIADHVGIERARVCESLLNTSLDR